MTANIIIDDSYSVYSQSDYSHCSSRSFPFNAYITSYCYSQSHSHRAGAQAVRNQAPGLRHCSDCTTAPKLIDNYRPNYATVKPSVPLLTHYAQRQAIKASLFRWVMLGLCLQRQCLCARKASAMVGPCPPWHPFRAHVCASHIMKL